MSSSRTSDSLTPSTEYQLTQPPEEDGLKPSQVLSDDPVVISLPNSPEVRLSLADLHAHRDTFLADGTIPGGVRPVIRESWERCISLSVNPSILDAQTLDRTILSDAVKRSARLLEHTIPFLDQIHDALGDQPHVLVLSDERSRILRLRMDPLTALDAHQANLFEGASWSEQDMGCNGIGTALATAQPVVIIGPEHFQRLHVRWTCIGVPIRDAGGSIVGALSLSVPNAHVQTHTWGWIRSIAKVIEIQLQSTNGTSSTDSSQKPAPHEMRLTEVTPREVAAARAEKAEEKGRLLDAFMAYVPEGITIADAPDVRIRMVSEYGRRLIGRPSDEIEGIPVHEHAGKWHIYSIDGITPARDEDLPLSRATLKGEVVINEEWIIERADGTRITILCNAGPIRDDEGRITGGLVAWRDISDRKRMERELRQSRNQMEKRVEERTADLAARNRELQNFAYVASHDMREPLRKIQSFGDLMKSDLGDRLGEDGLAYLARMSNAAERMSNLLDDLLAFSRVSTHVRPFQRVALEDVLEEVRDEHAVTLEELGARLDVEASGILDADRPQLYHLLSHLVGNAIKYRREQIPLVMRIHASSESVDGVERVTIAVEDNGIGIEERFLDRVFEPFQRLHGRDMFGGGTGMGLAICQRIAERHRGIIRAESEFGKGSRFIVTLPCRQPQIDI